MYKLWAFLARFSSKMAKKSLRGKAIRDKSGLSARQRAFSYFYQGLRPSQCPDLGVPMATIYRYYQAWKHRYEDIEFRVLRKVFKEDAGLRLMLTKKLGISEQDMAEALKGCRNPTQFRRRLGIEKNLRSQYPKC